MILNIFFTIIMVALAVWDSWSFEKKQYKNFKSLIMSVGILGTFAGIFVGLLGFDTRNLLESVPTLLDGLKTAFYTSIVGMGLAIALSIYQKGRGIEKKSSEIGFIATQSHKFDELLHLRDISNMVHVLHNIHTQITKNHIQKDSFESELKTLLKDIDTSLHKALETFASGASKELIKALEIVISDFNTNLKEQFGENFKQLNEATKNMLVWQDNYKEQIEYNTQHLLEIQKTLQDAKNCIEESTHAILASKVNMEEIQQYHAKNSHIQEQLTQALHTLHTLETTFEEKLQAISMLKDSSIEALQTSKDFILSLRESKENLYEYLKHYENKLTEFLNQNLERLNETHLTLKAQNNAILESMQNSHASFTDSLNQTHTAALESFKDASETSTNLAKTINNDLQIKSNAILELSQSSKAYTDSLLEKLDEMSKKSMQYAQDMHGQLQNLYTEKFEILNTNISQTTQTLQNTLHENALNLKTFTQDSLQIITASFNERDKILQDSLQNNHQVISDSISTLHTTFQEKVVADYALLQDKITTHLQTAQETLHTYIKDNIDKTKEYFDENNQLIHTSTKKHNENIKSMHEISLEHIHNNLDSVKHFLTHSQQESLNTLENLHKNALDKMEHTNTQTMQNTVDNLHKLQHDYKENLESQIKIVNDNLQQEIQTLHKNTHETYEILQKNLESQHTATTDSILEIMKNSSQYFIQTSGDFHDLLKGQYKRMNATFDKHTQELSQFLDNQMQNLQTNLELQNTSLKESFESQAQHLNHSLIQKSDILHEFLQTQTIHLDTNLQQMLNKLNKMLEHNYMNLSEMLEKDNTLIVKSLDSQAIHISNNLIQSHKNFDDFLHTTYEKFSQNANSLFEKFSSSTLALSKNFTITSDSVKNDLESLMQTISNTHLQSQKIYDEKMQNNLDKQRDIIENIESQSQRFYQNLDTNLNNLIQQITVASNEMTQSCQTMTQDVRTLQHTNQSLHENLLKNTNELTQHFYTNLESNLTHFTTNFTTQLQHITQQNEDLLQSFGQKITHFDAILGNFESNSKQSFGELQTNFKNLCVQYIKLIQASMQANLKNQNLATQEINTAILAIKDTIITLTESSNTLFDTQKAALNEVVEHFKANIQEIVKQGSLLHENLGNNLELLDEKMEKMTQNFANNYEWFLKKVREIMGVA